MGFFGVVIAVVVLSCDAFWTFVGMSDCGILLLFFANFVLFALLSYFIIYHRTIFLMTQYTSRLMLCSASTETLRYRSSRAQNRCEQRRGAGIL